MHQTDAESEISFQNLEKYFHFRKGDTQIGGGYGCVRLVNLTEEGKKKFKYDDRVALKTVIASKSDHAELEMMRKLKEARSHDEENPFMLKVLDVLTFNADVDNLVKLKTLLNSRKCPSFTEKIEELIKKSGNGQNAGEIPRVYILIMERLDSDLFDESMYYEDQDKLVMKQVLFSIAYSMFHHEVRFLLRHRDIKIENIGMRANKLPDPIVIKVGNDRWKLENMDYLPVVIDFDRSFIGETLEFNEKDLHEGTSGLGFPYLLLIRPPKGNHIMPRFHYGDDVWSFGMMMIQLPAKDLRLSHLFDKQVLNSGKFGNIVKTIIKKYSDYVGQPLGSYYPFLISGWIYVCVVQHQIGNGFLPGVESIECDLSVGRFYRLFAEYKERILELFKDDSGDPWDFDTKAFLRHTYGEEGLELVKKCLSWSEKQRAHVDSESSPHYLFFYNVIKHRFFESLKMSSNEKGYGFPGYIPSIDWEPYQISSSSSDLCIFPFVH